MFAQDRTPDAGAVSNARRVRPGQRAIRVDRRLPLLLVIAILAILPACGGGGGRIVDPPIPTPTPAPVRSVVASGSTELVVDEFVVVSFTTPGAGALDATVDWTFASDLLVMYITQGGCTVEQFAEDVCPDDPACGCRIAVRAENAFIKPRLLSLANAAAGPYTLIVWNLGPRDESISWQVGLTRAGSSSLDGPLGMSTDQRGYSRSTPTTARVHIKKGRARRVPSGE